MTALSQTTWCRQNNVFSRLATPPRQRHANSNARTPQCEDGVDPLATTAGAANDETTADEDGY